MDRLTMLYLLPGGCKTIPPLALTLNSRVGRDEVVQLDHVLIPHAHAADRAGLAHFCTIRGAVDVDIAAHRIDPSEAVLSHFLARQPEDARQHPVAPRIARVQLGRPDLAGGTAAHEDRVRRLPAADLRP